MNNFTFDKEQLVNLEYSLNREILRSNRAGSYISTTLNGCNTRKYHGVLVSPIERLGGEKFVLLSSLDATIVQNKEEFNLGIHRYKGGIYEPKGHKYIQNVDFEHIPKITYRIGGVVLTMERILVEQKEQVLIRYTLEETTVPVVLRLKPFLAFRNIHELSKANMFANTKFSVVENGIKIKLYEQFPDLFLQLCHENEFVPVPDWYYNIEYLTELTRGYDYLEDLFVPGYFELPLTENQPVVFAAGTEETRPVSLKQRFTRELKKRGTRFTFLSSLQNAGEQFIFQKNNSIDIIAGFPWYNSITRQTFISLPGLYGSLNRPDICIKIVETYMHFLKNGMFPDSIQDAQTNFHSADSPLWFIWSIQHLTKKMLNEKKIWKQFGPAIKEILEAFRNSTPGYIGMNENGLIYAEKEGAALTWMNSYSSGIPVVQRAGFAVEVNALWYNAICFALVLAEKANDKEFIQSWQQMKQKVAAAFLTTFWSNDRQHLADVVKDKQADWAVRPNMVIAAALIHTPLSRDQQKSVLSVAKQKLLTRRGLRTLSPDHLRYRGFVEGNQDQRELSVHQGAVYPWLIRFFVEAYLRIHKRGGLPFVKQLMEAFEEEMTEHSIGTISEMYDGNPPHKAQGSISQAWNVAGVLYATKLVQNFKE